MNLSLAQHKAPIRRYGCVSVQSVPSQVEVDTPHLAMSTTADSHISLQDQYTRRRTYIKVLD